MGTKIRGCWLKHDSHALINSKSLENQQIQMLFFKAELLLISPSVSSSHAFQDHLELLFLYRSLEIMLGPLGSFFKWQGFHARIWSLDMTRSFQQISVQESTVGPSKSKMTVATFKPGRLIVPNYQACASVRCRENESSRDGHVYHNTMF